METDLIALLVQAHQLISEHNWEDAAELYHQALIEMPDNSHIITGLAGCYFHLGIRVGGFDPNSQQAIQWYQKAIDLDPNREELYYLLGNCYELLELDYEKAVQFFKRAVELNPYYVPALVATASHYKDPEKVVTISEAIEWLERATSIQPDNGDIYHSLGRAYYEAGKYEKAEEALVRALLCPARLHKEAIPGVGKLLITLQHR